MPRLKEETHIKGRELEEGLTVIGRHHEFIERKNIGTRNIKASCPGE